MEAQRDPFRRGLPTLQTSLTYPELPPYPRHLRSENSVRFFESGGDMGEVFGFGGRCEGVKWCGFAPVWWEECLSKKRVG